MKLMQDKCQIVLNFLLMEDSTYQGDTVGSELLLRHYSLGLNHMYLGIGAAKHQGCVDLSLLAVLVRV